MPSEATNDNWTQAQIDTLLRLCRERHTATDIALALTNEFGIARTRSAVLGKLSRLASMPEIGEAARMRTPWEREAAKRRANDRERARRLRAMKKAQPAAAKPSPIPPPRPPSSKAAPVALIDRQRDQCAYPLWDMSEHGGLVCGRPRVDSVFSFCAEHYELCVQPWRKP